MDYEKYRFSKKQACGYLLSAAALAGGISFLFYRSAAAFFAAFLFLPLYLKRKRRQCIRRRKEDLTMQFKDAILAFANALTVGYSIENAWRETYQDMKLLYSEDADMMREISEMIRKLDNNAVLETLLLDFGSRAGVEDIMDFAEVFSVAKRSGGDLNKVIQRSVETISSKIEVRREIQICLAAKQYEQRIMNVIPAAMIMYISLSSPHYFDVLYHNAAGVLIMSACLLLYAGAFLLSEKIMREVSAPFEG